VTQPKEQNKSPVISPKEMRIYELSNNEFKIKSLKSSISYKRTQRANQVKSRKLSMNKIRISTKQYKP
jgi:hypothetical protein